MRKWAILWLVMSLIGTGAVMAQDATPEVTGEPGPDLITVAVPGLMPEGIEFDATRGQFLLGSISEGTVSVAADDGTLTTLVESENLANVVGIQVDAERNRLLVATTDGQSTAGLGIYDLETGEEINFVDLTLLTPDASGHFANDVAVDAEGNAYVTDSAAGVIYKVDVDGNGSVFLADDSFSGMFTLNGITYNPDGYLVAVRNPDLIKIPLDTPEDFTVIESETSFSGGDGIIFLDAQTLVVVSGDQGLVLRMTSDDDWASATLSGLFITDSGSPTTAAVRDGEVYIIYAKFNEPTATEYPIQKVTFADANG